MPADTPRTIPADPRPGERYAEKHGPGEFAWLVVDYKDDVHAVIASGLSEENARLLVYGAELVGMVERLLRVIGQVDGRDWRVPPDKDAAVDAGRALVAHARGGA